ncbi:MAG: hypothetical protein K0V04_18675 [Deltaproteobacteria bacterium]|nr:hypothetical protein [Deltaproteobacteria bacterium]
MRFDQWRATFERRATRPRPTIHDISEIPPPLRPVLAASLARFQLGETGEGRIVADLRRRATRWGLGDDYLESLRLFIAEEGRHAALLGTAVRALGGQTLGRTWSADAFAAVRRVTGPGFELAVLLAAEVAALSFYATLVEHLPRGPLHAALAEIAQDERVHLRFHIDFFRDALPLAPVRRAATLAWTPLGLAAGVVVATDHREAMRAMGVTPTAVLQRAQALVGETVAAIDLPSRERGKRSQACAAWSEAVRGVVAQPAATRASMARRV